MSETEREPSAALRDGIRHVHEWYSLLTDEARANCRGVSLTFDVDGLGVTVTLLPWWDDQEGEGKVATPEVGPTMLDVVTGENRRQRTERHEALMRIRALRVAMVEAMRIEGYEPDELPPDGTSSRVLRDAMRDLKGTAG